MHMFADERLPLEEFPQSLARMTRATRRFGETVLNKALIHSADPDLHPPFLIEVIPGLGLLRENQLWLSGA